MDPFVNNFVRANFNTINTTSIDYKIEIWLETMGRKKNTYISGWNISENEVKEHLKYIKKKNGCNGTIKKNINDTNEKIVILLQGDHRYYMYDYLHNQGINQEYIHIKGKELDHEL
jgi:translation initiation factor 1 (eIF-1/SUI1)